MEVLHKLCVETSDKCNYIELNTAVLQLMK
jgi:hypothetical protein